MENSRKGTENNSGTMRTNRRSRSLCGNASPRMRKLRTHLSRLSLNPPWNCVTMRLQNPRCQRRLFVAGAIETPSGMESLAREVGIDHGCPGGESTAIPGCLDVGAAGSRTKTRQVRGAIPEPNVERQSRAAESRVCGTSPGYSRLGAPEMRLTTRRMFLQGL